MKLIIVLAVLVGISVAAPIATFNNLDEKMFSSKENYEKYLKKLHGILDQYKGVMIPDEIHDFMKNLTVDDYEAVKMMMAGGPSIDEDTGLPLPLHRRIQLYHPDFYKRLMTAGIGLLGRFRNLSTSTKNRMINVVFIAQHTKKNETARNMKLGEAILKYYLSWPQENKDEFEQIFPQLSSQFEEIFKKRGEDTTFKYPEGVSDCTVDGEKPFMCSFAIGILNMDLSDLDLI
ncbi:hypothetical protein QR680_014581 [Steinernema hermaphroditum]|uniref:Uncharacterized protein n=1 Tax=Steinernema hermaphroditum TaxID=289476 RepID=A0AA39M3G0_9BILA|nr:hypothetical protein QR680_014581 [Steinernema hermaphroditum]